MPELSGHTDSLADHRILTPAAIPCAAACGELAYEDTDYTCCDGCNKRFCPDCLEMVEGFPYCAPCAKDQRETTA